jgi:hypothetical protein
MIKPVVVPHKDPKQTQKRKFKLILPYQKDNPIKTDTNFEENQK